MFIKPKCYRIWVHVKIPLFLHCLLHWNCREHNIKLNSSNNFKMCSSVWRFGISPSDYLLNIWHTCIVSPLSVLSFPFSSMEVISPVDFSNLWYVTIYLLVVLLVFKTNLISRINLKAFTEKSSLQKYDKSKYVTFLIAKNFMWKALFWIKIILKSETKMKNIQFLIFNSS